MTLRCECYDQGDDIVFGPLHQCTSRPALTTSLKRAEQDDVDARLERPYERVLSDGDGDLG